MTKRERAPALQRLMQLGPVFSLADMQVRFDFDPDVARVTVSRWNAANLVERLGGGVYFNLIADADGPQARVGEGLDKLLRRPLVLVGGAVLHRAGWTTQIHRRFDVAVPVARGRLTLPRLALAYALVPRTAGWHAVLREHMHPELGLPGVPSVTPEMALADALMIEGQPLVRKYSTYIVPPDELDLDDLFPERLQRVVSAMVALGASRDDALRTMKPYLARFD